MREDPLSEKGQFDRIERRIEEISSPGIRPGLSRMARLCSLIGNPERHFPAIHVLGTNGKGSVCAAIESILIESGYRTARYTSPHLQHLGERLLFDGKRISPKTWDESFGRVREAVLSDPVLSYDRPSVFEVLTAVAFHCISEGNREIAVIEAGLGGRLDATNLMGAVKMTVFTALGLDHEDLLGQGIRSIAGEKFAALRPSVPAVSYFLDRELEALLSEHADKLASPLTILGKDALLDADRPTLQGSDFALVLKDHAPIRLKTPLLGGHQAANAAIAALACLELSKGWPGISPTTIARGLEKTTWPGRLEFFPFDPPVLLDGAHNPQGTEALSSTILSLWPGLRPVFVLAAMKDKDIPGMLRALLRCGGDLFITHIPGMDRCEKPDALAEKAKLAGWTGSIEVFDEPRKAVASALRRAEIVVCTGSLYFIGHLRGYLVETCSGGGERK